MNRLDEAYQAAKAPPLIVPSNFQQGIFDFIEDPDQGNLMVEAVAGSGKTWTMVEALKLVQGRVLFCAFNKHIADELSRRAPGNARVSTIHSLGFRSIAKAGGRVTVNANKVRGLIKQLDTEEEFSFPMLRSLEQLTRLVKVNLADPTDEGQVQQIMDHYDLDDEDLEEGEREEIVTLLPQVIEEDAAQLSTIDFDDMIWLPNHLNLKVPKHDWIFVDEAQDLNAAQRELVLRASAGRMAAIGDSNQCQPGGSRILMADGTWRLICNIKPFNVVQSFDRNSQVFVPRKVKKVAMRRYEGRLLRLCKNGPEVTPEHRVLARWKTRSSDLWCTYLMARGEDYRIGWCQLFSCSKGSANFHLAQRTRLERADRAWILAIHTSKTDAACQEAILSAKFGLPMLRFYSQSGYEGPMNQKAVDSVFSALDTKEAAERCLDHFGRSLAHPFFNIKRRKRQGRTTFFLTEVSNLLCGYMQIPAMGKSLRKPEWVTVSLSDRVVREPVYSLEIEGTGYYVTDGCVVVHNSIYGWAGADTGSMGRIRHALNATQLPLSICYRCPTGIVALAKEIVPQIQAAPGAPDGVIHHGVPVEKMLGALAGGDLVICRINAPLAAIAMKLIREGKKATIRGRDISSGLISLIRKMKADTVEDLIRKLNDYRDRQSAKFLAAGKEEKAMRLADKVETIEALADGASKLGDVESRIRSIFSDDNVGIVLSSVHRAKGLEADRVFLYAPELLPHPMASGWQVEQEYNLKYVALTRAKKELWFVPRGKRM